MRKWVLPVLILVAGVFGGGYVHAAEEKAAEDPMLECAQTIAESLHSRPLRIQALARLSSYYAEMGDDEKAREYFSQAKDFADELPFTYRDSIWKQVAGMFMGIGEYGYALDSARLMGTREERLNTVSMVTRDIVNRGSIQRAERAVQRLLDQAKEEERVPMRLTGLMLQGSLNARKGDEEAADMSYRQALKVAQDNTDLLDSGTELVLDDYVKDCQIEQVITAVKRFFHGTERGRKLHLAGMSCLEAEKEEAGQKAFEESVVVLRDAEDPNERVLAQAELAEEHAKDGRSALAERLTEDAVSDLGEVMDPVAKDQARRSVAVAQAWTGKLDEALETTETIGDSYEKSLAMIEVAGMLAKSGSIERALQVAKDVPKEYEQDKAYAEIASAVLVYQDHERGKSLVRNKVQRQALKATVLVNASKTLSKQGKYERALDATQQIPTGMGSRDVAAEKVVEAVIDKLSRENVAENVPLAKQAIKVMGYQHRTWSPLLDLASKCEEFERYEDAVELLEKLYGSVRSPGYKAISLCRQARVYAKMGDRSRVEDTLERIVEMMEDSQSGDGQWSVVETAFTTFSQSEASKSLLQDILEKIESPYVKSRAMIWKLQRAAEADELGPGLDKDLQEILSLVEGVSERMVQMGLILTTASIVRDQDVEMTPGSPAGKSLQKMARAAEEARVAAEQRAQELKQRAGAIKLAFFKQVGCSACAKVEPVVKAFNAERPDVQIKEYEITVEGGDLLTGLGRHTGLPKDKVGRVPAIFSDRMGLVGMSIDPQTLKQVANSSTGKAPWNIQGLRGGASSLGFVTVVFGGLLDGINPCAFTVWIFLIAYLGYMQKSRKEMAIAGLVFTGAVFLTYLAIGLGLRSLLQIGGDLWVHFNTALQLVVAGLVLVLAVLSFADGLLASKGRVKDSWLKLPDSWQSTIRQTISKKARLGLTVGGTLVLGVLVAAIEFPCTGQVYVSILSILQSQPFRANALAWLVLYNVCFVLPLLAVFVLTFYGLTSEKLREWFKQHMAKVKFGLSGFFVFLFIIMVLLLTGVLGGTGMEDAGHMMQPDRSDRAMRMGGGPPARPSGPLHNSPGPSIQQSEGMDSDGPRLPSAHPKSD